MGVTGKYFYFQSITIILATAQLQALSLPLSRIMFLFSSLTNEKCVKTPKKSPVDVILLLY